MRFSRTPSQWNGKERLRLLGARWPLILLVTSTVLLAGAALRRWFPPQHEAIVRLSVVPRPGTGAGVSHAFRLPRGVDLSPWQAELEDPTLRAEVAAELGLAARWKLPDESRILGRLSEQTEVESRPAERALVLRVRESSPQTAVDLANALATKMVSREQDVARSEARERVRRLEEEYARVYRDTLRDPGTGNAPGAERRDLLRQALEAQIFQARLEVTESAAAVAIAAAALSEQTATIRPLALRIPVLVAIGLGAGLLLAFSRDVAKGRWDLIADLMRSLEVPVAGFAPLTGRSWVADRLPSSEWVESYRDLRNRLLRLPAGDCLLLTFLPVGRHESHPEVLVNLSCTLADAGRTTLVIDADCRGAGLHPFFDAARHPGLGDFLSGEMRLEETVIRSRRPNLWFMPAGPSRDNSGELLHNRRLDDLLWELKSRFDAILIASPSLGNASEAGILTALADYTLLTTDFAGHSLRRLRATRTALETVSATLGGVILTTSPVRTDDSRSLPHPVGRRPQPASTR